MTEAKPMVARVTVNLSTASVKAIEEARQITDETKTAVINKGVQLFNDIMKLQAEGGSVYFQKGPDKKLVEVKFM